MLKLLKKNKKISEQTVRQLFNKHLPSYFVYWKNESQKGFKVLWSVSELAKLKKQLGKFESGKVHVFKVKVTYFATYAPTQYFYDKRLKDL